MTQRWTYRGRETCALELSTGYEKEERVSGKTPVFLFEDHDESYFLWREHGKHGKVVLHVDAHFDFADEGLDPPLLARIASCRSLEDLRALRGDDPYLWAGIHVGNYLYPALHDGTVALIYWVLPPFLIQGSFLDWARKEAANWVDLTVEEFKSFTPRGGRIHSTIKGKPVIFSTLESLPSLQGEQLLLDIDVDFFFSKEDLIWISPFDFLLSLQKTGASPEMVTIAYSVNGGYTSLEHRYLGDLLKLLLAAQQWSSETPPLSLTKGILLKVMEGDTARKEGRLEDALFLYAEVLKVEEEMEEKKQIPCSLFAPACHYKMGQLQRMMGKGDARREFDTARFLDPMYAPHPINEAMASARREEFETALSILAEGKEVESSLQITYTFLQGLVSLKGQKYKEAISYWRPLIQKEAPLNNVQKAYVCKLLAEAYSGERDVESGVKVLKTATILSPSTPLYHLRHALFLQDAGRDQEAERELRKVIRMTPDSMHAHLARESLARIYKKRGLVALADAEIQQILSSGLPSLSTLQTLLLRPP